MAKKTIIFTGGGSGGHVMPAVTLIKRLQEESGYDIHYIGSRTGIEYDIVTNLGVPYHTIATGKLRRYFSLKNVWDIFKVFWGVLQSFRLLLKYPAKSTLVFSTGGFVTVPVVIGAWLSGKTIFIHEQTSRVGLANRIAAKFADKIFMSFEASKELFPKSKSYLTGYPLREACFTPPPTELVEDGIRLHLVNKPILFVTGGGNGARLINELVRENLAALKEKFYVFHQVGKNFVDEYKKYNDDSYHAVAFVENMIEVMKLSSVVISRAGAGTVSELMALGKKSIFIPLKIAQKNEQYHNAMEAHDNLGSIVIEENDLPNQNIVEILSNFDESNKETTGVNGTNSIIQLIHHNFLN